MNIEIIPCLNDNYSYLIHDQISNTVAIVDPSEFIPCEKIINKNYKKLDYILNTHHHFDHVGGNEELKKKYNSTILGFEKDKNRIPDIDEVLKELLRIGKFVIVSIPNFGYWKVRTSLLFFGKMPMTKTLPYSWHNTPNLHMCSIKDLFNYCDEQNIKIQKVVGVNENKISLIKKSNLELKNFFSKLGIFLIG